MTSEWLIWNIAVRVPTTPLAAVVPVTGGPFNSTPTTTYTLETPDPIIDRDVPQSFDLLLSNLSGTESFFTLKPGAISFVHSSNANASGLAVGITERGGRSASPP